jgi:hypothetical protein
MEEKRNLSAPQAPPPQTHLSRSRTEIRQSYGLLALGIVIAIVLPFLLRPRASESGGAPTTSASGALLGGRGRP